MQPEPASDPSDIERELAARLAAIDQGSAADAAHRAEEVTAGLGDEAAERLHGALECLERVRKLWPRPEQNNEWPQQFGRFILERELGRGGHGIVFLALDPTVRRRVALKVPHPECLDDPDLKRRFFQEARAVAKLDHPGIVPLLELGEVGPVCYMASTYCSGPDLGAWLTARREPLSPRDAAHLMAEIAEAIGHAHARGVVHRDIKPQNILLEECTNATAPELLPLRPRVTDFGLAKLLEADADRTRTGVVIGTPRYMAPEQVLAKHTEIGPPADVYAMGLILQRLMVGRKSDSEPAQNESARILTARFEGRVASAHVDPTGEQMRAPTPPVPIPLQAILCRCLEHEPGRRYADASLLAADLRRFLAGEPVLAQAGFYRNRLRAWAAQRPALAIGGVIIATIILTAIALEIRRADRPDPMPTPAVERQSGPSQADRLARTKRYVEDLQIACRQAPFAELTSYKLDQSRFLLDRHRPGPGEEDLRSLEWYFLWNVLHGERDTLKGPTGEVYWLTYSPDGRWLASAGQDGALLWDAATGELRLRLHQNGHGLLGVCFSPDSTRLATASEDQSARVWSAVDGRPLLPALVHKSKVVVILFTPDGKQLITAERGGTVTVWDATTGAVIRSIASISSTPLEGMVLSPDGTVLATASSTEVKIWEYPSMRQRREPIRSDAPVRFFNSIAFSHDGRQFATACGAELSVRTWETATGKLLFSRSHYPNERVMSVAFSPDDRTLVSTGADGATRLWDLVDPNPDASPAGHDAILAGHTDWVWCAAFAPDGKTLATASKDKTVKLWKVPPRKIEELVALADDGPLAAGYSAAGRFLYTIRRSGQCDLWDSEPGGPRRTLPFAPASACLAATFSSGCSLVAAVDAEGTISIGSPQDSVPRITLDRAAAASPCLTFSTDGRMLAFVTRDGSIGRVDSTNPSGTIERLASPGSAPTCLAYSPTGDFLAGGVDGHLVVWDVALGRVRAISELVAKEKLNSVAISPDGSLCATNGTAGEILLWDRITLRATGMIGQDKNPITCLAFSQDGLTLISGQRSISIHLWNVALAREIFPLKDDMFGTRGIAALCIAPGDTGVAAIATLERPGWTKNVLWRTGRISRAAGN
jgi:eukaryotic-like serine/threonine-protein kinase